MELRMKSVLTRPKVNRSNRDASANTSNVIKRQTIDAASIPITMRTGEITIIRQPDADRKPIPDRLFYDLGFVANRRHNRLTVPLNELK